MLCLIHSGPIPSVVRIKALNQNSITGHSIIKRHVQNIMCASAVCPYLSDICFWHWATTDSTLSSRGGTCQTVAVASFVCFVLLLLSFKSWAKCWDKDSFVVVSWWAALCASLLEKLRLFSPNDPWRNKTIVTAPVEYGNGFSISHKNMICQKCLSFKTQEQQQKC